MTRGIFYAEEGKNGVRIALYNNRRGLQAMSISEKGQVVHAIFTRIARNYDWTNAFLSLWQDKRWRRSAVFHCRPRPGESGLDLGCGTGKITFELARSLRGKGRVIGLDFNEAMLKIAEERLSKASYPQSIRFLLGNAMALPFPDATFDYATAGFLLRNVTNLEKALNEMVRVVKPGGRIVILELSQPKLPLFRQIYSLYFHHILPWIGKTICGSAVPYCYLPASVLSFPEPDEFQRIMRCHGLKNIAYHPLSAGIATLYIGCVAY